VSELLATHSLGKRFLLSGSGGYVKAVDGVSLTVAEGETLGVVGESGCGKTTLARLVLRLVEPTAGSVLFSGYDVTLLRKDQLRRLRSEMQLVFQDPTSSLNPRMNVQAALERPLRIHRTDLGASDRRELVSEMLVKVGLRPEHAVRYPHQFSGGQRQRICVARALMVHPRLLVLDEPTSALDVSVQAQILNLLRRLQSEFGLSYLYISHDLSTVRYMSDRVAVMYLGRVVELTTAEQVFTSALHPYTRALMAAVLAPDPSCRGRAAVLGGEVPSSIAPPTGCHFHPRCPQEAAVCKEAVPELRAIAGPVAHLVACHQRGGGAVPRPGDPAVFS